MDANNNNTWRQGLPQDSRQRIVKRIMDILQRQMPPTGSESIGELLKIAWRFEEKIFQAATDQQDYLRKISLKMLSWETKAQATPASATQARIGNQAQNLSNGVQLPGAVSGPSQERQQLIAQSLQNNLNANVMQSSSGLGSGLSSMTGVPQATLSGSSASVDSSGHSGAGGVGLDHREVVWPKLQVLKDKYLQDMKELYGMLTQRSTMPMPPKQPQKLKHYKDVLQRMIPYLTVPKERVPHELNQDKVEAFEKQIVIIMETFKRSQRRQAPPQQPVLPPQQQLQPNQVPQPPQQQGQQQQQQQHQQQLLSQIQQQDNKQMPLSGNLQPTASSLHSNNFSSIPLNMGSALQQPGMSFLQQTGVNSAQAHAPGALPSSNVNPSQQSVVPALQSSGVSTMQQNGNQQQTNVNPLQQTVANSLQPNALNSLQQSVTMTHQPSVVNSLQQQNGVNALQQSVPINCNQV